MSEELVFWGGANRTGGRWIVAAKPGMRWPLEVVLHWSAESAKRWDWGRVSADAVYTAYALLVACGVSGRLANVYADDFCATILTKLGQEGWTLHQRVVIDWLRDTIDRHLRQSLAGPAGPPQPPAPPPAA